MKSNSRAFNRYNSRKKALRKRRIAREIYPNGDKCPYYDNLHQYSKNKIHCSCPLCSAKTRNKGKHRYKNENYFRHLNYKTSELRRIIAMDQDIYEIINREENEKESAAAASSLDLA